MLKQGNHGNRKLQRAWNKYGASIFTFQVLLLCPPEDRLEQEQSAIDLFDTVKHGYNIRPKAETNEGWTPSAETREKIRQSNSGKIRSAETRTRLSVAAQNRSPETRAKISANTTAWNKMRPPISLDTRAKLSAASKRMVRTPEHCEKISASLRGKPKTAEHRKKLAEATRAHWARKREGISVQ